MKIAIVAPTEIPSRRANTMQVMKMAQSIYAQGHAVQLAAPRSAHGDSHQEVDWALFKRHYGIQHSFPIVWLPASKRWRRYDFSLHAIRWARLWNAEIIYTRLPQAAALASMLGMLTILEIHDMPQGRLGPWLFRRFIQGGGARRMVVITLALAKDLANRFNAPTSAPFTIIAPDGVDLERYSDIPTPERARREFQLESMSPADGALKLPIERFTAGYTGHLYPGRGSNLMLALAKRLPDISFLIVGGRPKDLHFIQGTAAAEQQ